jgi:hypothetical protein
MSVSVTAVFSEICLAGAPHPYPPPYKKSSDLDELQNHPYNLWKGLKPPPAPLVAPLAMHNQIRNLCYSKCPALSNIGILCLLQK